MNVKHILCPTDFSDSCRFSLEFAAKIAKESNAELHIVHVLEVIPLGVEGFEGFSPDPENYAEIEEHLKAMLPQRTKVPCHHALLHGPTTANLLDYAEEHQIDLIVISTHGRRGISRLLMGSVAEQILRRAECPVMTIRQPAEKSESTCKSP